MATSKWEWSDGASAAIYYDSNGKAQVTVSGISSAGVSGLGTPDDGGRISVSEQALAGLAGGSSITLVTSGYMFVRDTDLREKAEIDSTSVTVSNVTSNQATITGNVKDYYDLTSSTVTLYKGASNANLAIISGLADSTAVLQLAGDDKNIIKVDKTDLKQNTNLTLALQSVSGITGLSVADYGFNFKLYTENDGNTLANGGGTSVGFEAGNNRWTLGAESKSAIYQSTTEEGWKLVNGGTISYVGTQYTALATIGGFQKALAVYQQGQTDTYLHFGEQGDRAITASVYGGGISFIVNSNALSSAAPLTLTKADGASGTYRFQFADALNSSVTNNTDGTSVYGLSAHKDQAYWRIDGTSAYYQYNTDEGWTINKAGTSISYSAATSGNTATKLAAITGLSAGLSVTGQSTINGISIANGTATLRTFTITDATQIFAQGATNTTLNFKDANLNDGIDFNFGLSTSIASLPAVNYSVSATTAAVASDSSVAYIKGSLSAYYTQTGTASTAAGVNVVYHAPQSNQTIATITGLSAGASVEIGGTSLKELKLDAADLNGHNVSLTTVADSIISGIKNYALSLSSNVSALSSVVDTAVSASLENKNNAYEVYGMTKEYYTLSGDSQSVTYNNPTKAKLATISGLSNVTLGSAGNASIGGTSGRTIYLKESALDERNVRIGNEMVGDSNSHGLKFQLITASGASATQLGFEDSGDYWTLAGDVASYVHHTQKGWQLTGGDALLSYTPASSLSPHISISGLATTGTAKAVIEGSGTAASIGTKDNLNNFTAGISISGNSVVTISQALLGRDSTRTVSVQGAGYSFALDGDNGQSAANLTLRDAKANDGIVGLFNGYDAGEAYWSITGNGNAVYQYKTSAGWKYDSLSGTINYIPETTTSLVTITGLQGLAYENNALAGTSLARIQGIGLSGDNKTILLDTSILSTTTTAVQLADNTNDDHEYALGFSAPLTGSSGTKAGFGTEGGSSTWIVNGTTATYYAKTDAGWILGGSGTEITYIPSTVGNETYTELAVVTGLKDGLTTANLLGGYAAVSAGTSTITLNKNALDETKVNTVQITGGSYTLALDTTNAGTSVVTMTGVSTAFGLHYVAPGRPAYDPMQILVKETRIAGWSLAGDSKSATYYEAVDTPHATVTGLGLSKSAITNDASLSSLATLTGNSQSGWVIALSDSALATAGNITLEGTGYSLSLAGDIGATSANDSIAGDGRVGFMRPVNDWDKNATAGTMVYYYQTDGGWSLGSDSKTITYVTKDATKTTLAAITGLKKSEAYNVGSASTDNMSISGMTISISTALIPGTVSLTAGGDSYKLALMNDAADGKLNQEGFAHEAPNFQKYSITNGTAKLTQEIAEGWTLSENVLSHKDAETWELASVKGLKSGAKYTDLGLSFAAETGGGSYHKITITLGQSALGTEAISLEAGTNLPEEYFYAFAISGAKEQADHTFTSGFDTVGASWTKDEKTGVFTYYSAGQKEGWTISDDGQLVTYTEATPTPLFTLKGLSGGLSAGDLTSSNITVTEGSGTTPGTIKILNKSLLGTSDVVLTAVDGKTFNLELNSPDDWKSGIDAQAQTIQTTAGGYSTDANGYYWVVKDGTSSDTATYYANMKEGWAVDDTKQKISYTAGKQDVVFTITGLNTALVNDASASGLMPDINSADFATLGTADANGVQTLTLGASALTASNVKFTVSDDYKGKFVLGISGATKGVLGGDIEKRYWALNGTTATYKQDINKTYTLNSDGNAITYTAPVTGAELAKITGLVSGLTTSNTVVGGVSYVEIGGISVNDITSAASVKRTYKDPVAASGNVGAVPIEITVNSNVLGATNVAITNGKAVTEGDFVLKLAADVSQEGEPGANYWTINKTTATYKNDTAAYYSIDDKEKNITYHKPATETLATLTNIKSGTTVVNNGTDKPTTIEGITVVEEPGSNGTGGKIYVSDEVLGTDAKNGLKLKENSYTLALDSDVNTSSATTDNYWTYGATTKLQTYALPYYTINNNEVTYHASVASKDSKNKAIVPITITGLNKNVGDEDIIFFDDTVDDTSTPSKKVVEGTTYTQQEWANMLSGKAASLTGADAAKVADYAGTVILTADALNSANVKLTNGTQADGKTKFDYKLALLYGVSAPTPAEDIAKWTINKTTATLKGNATAGYTQTSDTAITYTKAKKNANLLTITGLPTGMTLSTTKSDWHEKIDGVSISNDGVVTFSDTILKQNLNDSAKDNFTKITVKGTGYTIGALSAAQSGHTATNYYTNTASTTIYTSNDEIVSGSDTVEAGVDVWRISGTTATYKRIIPAHYEINKNGALVFVKEATAKMTNANGKKVDAIYFTITGLQKNSLEEGSNGKNLVLKGTTTEAISVDGKNVTITNDALGTSSKITLNDKSKGGYTFDFTNTTQSDQVWAISGTTATLKEGKTAGWESNDAHTVLSKKGVTQTKGASTIVQVKGLKSGLKVNTNGQVVTTATGTTPVVSAEGNTVTILNDALGTSAVSVNNGYTINASGANTDASATGYNYTFSNGVLTIKSNESTKPYYVLNADGNKLTYKKGTASKEVVAKIKGLKNAKVKADGTIDGVNFDGNTVTVDSRVLGTSAVTVTSGDVKLALATSSTTLDNIDAAKAPATSDTANDTYAWVVSGTKATIKQGKAAYYTLADNKITYTAPVVAAKKGTEVAVIENLKKGLKVANNTGDSATVWANKISDGITVDGSTLTLSANALDDKTITLTNKNGGAYSLVLADDSETAKHKQGTNDGVVWGVSGTTATLYKANTAGYATTQSDSTKFEYVSGITGTSTSTGVQLEGLKSNLRVNTDGTIDGITVDGDKISVDSRVLDTGNATLTTASDSTYKLHLVTKAEDSTNGAVDGNVINKCVVNGTTITIEPQQPKGYTIGTPTTASNTTTTTITYHAAAAQPLVATIEGVKKGLKTNSDGTLDGVTVTKDNSGTYSVKLSSSVLGTGDSIKITKGDDITGNMTVTFDETASNGDKVWSYKDGALILTTTAPYGYTYDSSTGAITYSGGETVTTTITGLSGITSSWINGTNLSSDVILNKLDITGLDDGVIKIKAASIIGDKKVTIAGGKYTLALDTNAGAFKDSTGSLKWNYVGSTATLTQEIPQNNFTCDGVSISKNTGANSKYKILATVTGLKKNLGATDDGSNGLKVSSNGDVLSLSNGVITLNDKAFDSTTGTIKLTGTGYTLNVVSTKDASKEGTTQWHLNSDKKSAIYAPTTSQAGLLVASDGKSATYKKAVLGSTLASITGIDTTKDSLIAGNLNNYIKVTDGVGTTSLNSILFGASDIKLVDKDPNDSLTGFKLVYATSGAGSVNTSSVASADMQWSVNSGVASYHSVTAAYYTRSNDSLTVSYHAPVFSSVTSASITGLKSGIAADANGSIKGITVNGNNISLGADVLGTASVSVGGAGNYSLKMADDVATPSLTGNARFVTLTSADTNAKSVSYVQNATAGFNSVAGGKSLEYYPAKTDTIFSIQGLNSGLSVESGYVNGIAVGTITGGNYNVSISGAALGTSNATITSNSSLTGGGKTAVFKLGSGVNSVSNSIGADWSISGSTATLSSVRAAYYSLGGAASNNTVIAYTGASVGAGLATLSGFKSFDPATNVNGTTITLYKSNLNNQSVSLTSGNTVGSAYEFVLAGDVDAVNTTTKWDKSGSSYTAKISKTAGYELSSLTSIGTGTSLRSVNYSDATTQAVATVTGAKNALSGDYINIGSNEISLSGGDLNNKVTIAAGSTTSISSDDYKFKFMYYSNGTVTGSDNADVVTFDGTKLSVSAGKGNDSIVFGSKGSNTVAGGEGNDTISLGGGNNVIVYNASVDGSDSITGFDASTDKIYISNATLASTAVSTTSSGATITVGNDKITLAGSHFSTTNLKIYDSTGQNIYEKTASADLLYDESDNFFTGNEDAELSYITNTSFHAHAFNEYDDPQDLTKLTKQSSLVFYGKDKK